jgi:hypothetical protein
MSASADDGTREPLEIARGRLRLAQARYRRDLVENFHSYLAPVVTFASPLLLDLCSIWDLDLEAMINRLRPPAGWPYPPKFRARRNQMPPRVTGTGDLGRNVQVFLMNDTLDVRVRFGEAFACTGAGQLQLWLADLIPETVQSSLPGRNLASVVDHPVLRMRPYRIIGSRSVGYTTVMDAEAPLVPYSLPWA